MKAKVKIVGWPSFGAESLKPRFQIRKEYDVVSIDNVQAAVLDDHNQVVYIGLNLLEFTQIGDTKLQGIEEFIKANPELDPSKPKAKTPSEPKAQGMTKEQADAARTDAKNAEAKTAEATQPPPAADGNVPE